MRQQAKDRHGGMSARIRTPRPRKVVVAVRMGNATGRQRLRGVYRYLAQNGDWDVQLVRTESELTAEYVRQACADGAEGFLVLFHPDAETIDELMSANRPVATFADDSVKDTPRVFLRLPDENNILIGETAARHFLSLGRYRSFGFVPSRTPARWSHNRQAAFMAVLRSHGKNLSVFGGSGNSREELGQWLSDLEKPTAILAAFDDRARDVLEACRARSISVPDQISVLGIGNDEPICETSVPALSSVAVDFEEEGYRAARELQAMMLSGRASSIRERPCGVREVVFRASTTASKTPSALVERALEFIRQHALEGISTVDVVKHLKISRSLADLRFREVTGSSILEEILARRLDAVKRLLLESDLRISDIAMRCGYRDANYLKNLFKSRVGMSMRAFRAYRGK